MIPPMRTVTWWMSARSRYCRSSSSVSPDRNRSSSSAAVDRLTRLPLWVGEENSSVDILARYRLSFTERSNEVVVISYAKSLFPAVIAATFRQPGLDGGAFFVVIPGRNQ